MKTPTDLNPAILAQTTLGGEEHREQITYNVHTQVLVPVLQCVVLIPCGLGIYAGLRLVAHPLASLLDLADGLWDLLLLSLLLVSAAWIAGSLVDFVALRVRDFNLEKGAWYPIARTLTAIGLVLLALGLAQAGRDGLTEGDAWRMVGGFLLVVPCSLLGYRFGQELFNPAYPTSPKVRAMRDYLSSLVAPEPAEPRERLLILNAGEPPTLQHGPSERRSQFERFVRGIPAKGTALRAWESELGRETYQEYRDTLIRLRWARWLSVREDGRPNERQGWELVKPVGEILERIRYQ